MEHQISHGKLYIVIVSGRQMIAEAMDKLRLV